MEEGLGKLLIHFSLQHFRMDPDGQKIKRGSFRAQRQHRGSPPKTSSGGTSFRAQCIKLICRTKGCHQISATDGLQLPTKPLYFWVTFYWNLVLLSSHFSAKNKAGCIQFSKRLGFYLFVRGEGGVWFWWLRFCLFVFKSNTFHWRCTKLEPPECFPLSSRMTWEAPRYLPLPD